MLTPSSSRFDQIAHNYAASEVHAMSPSIVRLHELLPRKDSLNVVDIACGAGHLALSFAKSAQRIVGVDASPRMLQVFAGLALQRNVQVETVNAVSEAVPLPDAQFDVAVSRLAPHHFVDLSASLAEMKRLVKHGGHIGIIDLEGYEDPELDRFNHEIELLHDPTHGRSYAPSVWRAAIDALQLDVVAFETGRRESSEGIPVRRWCEISASGEEAEREIRARLSNARAGVRERMEIVRRDDGEFLMPIRTLLIVARRVTT
jgi:ubiquinone/menaquinone biosynthesis C-methylase UbiE